MASQRPAEERPENPPQGFRLNSKILFLTYPQCPIRKGEALEQLTRLLPIEKACIGEEKHEDGSPHLHAYIKLTRKVNIKN